MSKWLTVTAATGAILMLLAGVGLLVVSQVGEDAASSTVSEVTYPPTQPVPTTVVVAHPQEPRRWMAPFSDDYEPPRGVEASGGGCGIGTSLDLINPDALGRTYRGDEDVVIKVGFDAPGCTTAGARFYGYHTSESRWYAYHCSDRECPERIYSTLTVNPPVPLERAIGTVAIKAESGPFPPPHLYTQPPTEGLRLCFVEVTFSDGEWAGTYYHEWFSDPCELPTLSPSDRTLRPQPPALRRASRSLLSPSVRLLRPS